MAALDWTRAEYGAYDVVLAADCVYDEALATPLVRTMSYAMRDGSVALVTVDEANRRPAALRAFLRVAERAFSSCREDPMAARSKWSRGDDRESIRLFVLRGPRLFNHQKPLRVVVAGPCGCGKTTVGRELAAVLGLPFIEGDDLHPAENVAKMKRGEALDDADRAPWLSRSGPRSAPARRAPSRAARRSSRCIGTRRRSTCPRPSRGNAQADTCPRPRRVAIRGARAQYASCCWTCPRPSRAKDDGSCRLSFLVLL